ncbi:carboxylating nicotinate-nucleotide diphosphorylase [Lentisalinibacter sediminis]|uniref:carboxylating nicotinate-nucleotide diphosphorylase n=1 Tax=Lentisalinibacter sediminis TaxID=2992237 RepID=UPI003870C465
MQKDRLSAHIRASVDAALAEDVGNGDVTAALIDPGARSRATVVCREAAILCGRAWFDRVFAVLDETVRIDWQADDGVRLTPGETVCALEGPARPILTGERTALNFLQTLSGTATAAARYAAAVAHTGCRILDTRKTIPGLRLAQKYAVRCGGAVNHRIGLFDAVLVKENHIIACGGIAAAVRRARAENPSLPIEVEVENIDELREALTAGADRLLLDNFPLDALREAVRITRDSGTGATLEASGGLEMADMADVAETGVDFISVGALTKHLRAVDYSMRFGVETADGH